MKDDAIQRLRGPILRDTSRSFYLSIRLLPHQLRDPIALAYLLARATDSIADTAEIDASLRTHELARLAARIQGTRLDGDSLQSFAELQEDAAEHALIGAVPACITWLESLPGDDERDIRNVLARINEGQTLDVQRFANPAAITAPPTAADLDRYTYLVAGCVGEFWTEVCFRHLSAFADRPISEMKSLGIDYGKGLQLVNILRDVVADLSAGRCYLPAEELVAAGVSPNQLRANPSGALPIINSWRERAQENLRSGIDYACAIRSFRVRLATALPALIGARTLALVRDAGSAVFERKIKVSRAEVRRIIIRVIASLASPRNLRDLFRHLSS